MTALFDAARAFAKLYPTRPASRDSGTWDQLCGILMIQFGGYLGGATAEQMRNYSPHVGVAPFWAKSVSGDISSAYRVAMNSGPLNPTAALAPVGAFHFFNIGGADNGHVGIDLNGGGTEVFMATSALAESWGSSIGVNSVWGYMGAKRAPYLGWSTNYGGGIPKLPPTLQPYQRVVNSGGVSIRVEPTSKSAKVGFFPPKQTVSFIGWARGELVEGVDVWFKFDADKWCWAGGFTDAGTHDLPDLTPIPEPEPTPEPEPEPEPTPEPTPEPEPPVVVPPVEPPTPEPDKPALNWITYLIGGVIVAIIGLWAVLTGGR